MEMKNIFINMVWRLQSLIFILVIVCVFFVILFSINAMVMKQFLPYGALAISFLCNAGIFYSIFRNHFKKTSKQ